VMVVLAHFLTSRARGRELFLVGRRELGDRRMLRKLQHANVGGDGPAVLGGDLARVARHLAEALGSSRRRNSRAAAGGACRYETTRVA